MKIFEKFPFLLGLIASLFILLSFMVKSPNSTVNNELAFMGLGFAAVYWVWIIIAIRASVKRNRSKITFWLIIAFIAPFVGALLYQIMQERKNELAAMHEQRKEMAA